MYKFIKKIKYAKIDYSQLSLCNGRPCKSFCEIVVVVEEVVGDSVTFGKMAGNSVTTFCELVGRCHQYRCDMKRTRPAEMRSHSVNDVTVTLL